MSNFLLLLAATGLFYTSLNASLLKSTQIDCNAGITAACKQIYK